MSCNGCLIKDIAICDSCSRDYEHSYFCHDYFCNNKSIVCSKCGCYCNTPYFCEDHGYFGNLWQRIKTWILRKRIINGNR